MKHLIFILLLSLSVQAVEKLEFARELKEHKLVFLAYEKQGCPWCVMYKSELEDLEKLYKNSIKIYKVKKGTDVAKKLRKEFGFKPIIYPMTYILKQDNSKKHKMIYEIYGYRDVAYIKDVFKELHIK